MDSANLSDRVFLQDLLNTILLLTVVLTARVGVVHMLGQSARLSVETRRRWALTSRNILALVFVIGLVFIWGHELSAFAVSIAAIAVAVVLATKELILCVSGGVLRAGTAAYTLGDRIELAGARGIVIDHTLLATTLLELAPGRMASQYTGRTVTLPNSLLLAHPVTNETYMKAYVLHVITVPLLAQDDWQAAERVLLDAAHAECDEYMDDAQREMEHLAGRIWLEAPSAQPRVLVQMPEPGRVTLLLRVAMPADRTVRLEQAIVRRFLLALGEQGKRQK